MRHKRNLNVCFWNMWGHRYPKGIHHFLLDTAKHAAVICGTEVTHISRKQELTLTAVTKYGSNPAEPPARVNGYAQLQSQLTQYDLRYHSPEVSDWQCERDGTRFREVGFGSVLATRQGMRVIASGEVLICTNMDGLVPRVLQWVILEQFGFRYLIAHIHGVWIAENTKGDHVARSIQSRQIRAALKSLMEEYNLDKVVLGGDFNLDLSTEALRILCQGENGISNDLQLRNLVTDYGIPSTRTPSYRKYGVPGETLYADYVLVSPSVVVEQFTVHTEVLASDHAPLVVSVR